MFCIGVISRIIIKAFTIRQAFWIDHKNWHFIFGLNSSWIKSRKKEAYNTT